MSLQSTFYNLRSDQGFTLIEALIYIVLFSVVIGGGLATAFYLIQGTDDLRREALAEAEANLVLRRIDQLLSGAVSASVISGGDGVSVDGTDIELDAPNKQITYDSTPLLSGNYDVDLKFTEVSDPDGVETILTINERVFHKIYYLR